MGVGLICRPPIEIDQYLRTIHIVGMVPLPARIYKHWIGYVVIALAAVSLIALLWVGLGSWMGAPGVDQGLVFQIAMIAILTVLVVAIVQIYVYSLSYIELTTDGIVIKNWITLFTSRDESFEWVRVSRSVATRGGIFGRVLNYGTIGIETNGGSIQATITLIPTPEYWQDQINLKADEATVDGTD